MNITNYQVLGKLPDPFTFDDGSKVTSLSDWERRREELIRYCIEMQYGGMPPEPEFVDVIPVHTSGDTELPCYRVVTGRRDHPVNFLMYLHLPTGINSAKPAPVVIDGDLCYSPLHRFENPKVFTDKGFIFCKFNRNDLIYDNFRTVPRKQGMEGPLYDCYPDANWGCISGWAWGFHRCVDALEKLGLWDGKNLAFTGCSRGAKTALLAGLTDPRATIISPVETCACGASCYRVLMEAICTDGNPARSERLKDQWVNYGFWLGEEMGKYADDPTALPFDSHETLALAAPRKLLIGNAEDDIWGNPLGAYQTAIAAQEVYKLYGCPENISWYWRKGVHGHVTVDFETLSQFLDHEVNGAPLPERLYQLPFDAPEPIFDWRCPETK